MGYFPEDAVDKAGMAKVWHIVKVLIGRAKVWHIVKVLIGRAKVWHIIKVLIDRAKVWHIIKVLIGRAKVWHIVKVWHMFIMWAASSAKQFSRQSSCATNRP